MGILDEPKNIKILRILFYLSLIVVVILEILIKREHIEFSFEHIVEFPAFHAIYGLLACILIILVSKFIGYLVMKREDYYD
jgi:hypothetical protein